MQRFQSPAMIRCLKTNNHLIVIIIAVAVASALGRDAAVTGLAALSPQDRIIELFNGQSLAGCYTCLQGTEKADPSQVFRIENELLHITGDGLGSVITERSYRDYHMVLEYRWGSRTWRDRKTQAKDSGLLIHSTGKNGGHHGIWMPSIEVQIIEGGVGDFILVTGDDEQGRPVPLSITCNVSQDKDGEYVWTETASRQVFNRNNLHRVSWKSRATNWEDVLGFRGNNDPDSPGDEWTTLEVIADGDHIEVFVNGIKVNEAFDVHPSEGRLQLQTELAELFVRKWQLLPLKKTQVQE